MGGQRWGRVGACWLGVVLVGGGALGGLAIAGGALAQAPSAGAAGAAGVGGAPSAAANLGAPEAVAPGAGNPSEPPREALPELGAEGLREDLRQDAEMGGDRGLLLGEFLRAALEAQEGKLHTDEMEVGAGVVPKAALPSVTTSNIGSLLQFFLRVFDKQEPGGCFDLVVDMGLGCFQEVQEALDKYAFATGEMMQGIPADMRPRYQGPDRVAVMAQLRALGVHEALALSLQAHYSEVYSQNLSVVEAAENPLNVTRIELMRGQVGVSEVCCGKFLKFLSKSCLCDSGVTGVLLEVGWGMLGEGDRGMVVGFAQDQCERSEGDPLFTEVVRGDLAQQSLAAIDNSAKCRCKQSRSSIRRAQESNERQNFGSFAEAMAFYSQDGKGGTEGTELEADCSYSEFEVESMKYEESAEARAVIGGD